RAGLAIGQAVVSMAAGKLDLAALKKIYESLKAAFAREGIEAQSWYDRYQDIVQCIQALEDIRNEIKDFLGNCKSLEEAFANDKMEEKTWYDCHQALKYASILSLGDSSKYSVFHQGLEALQNAKLKNETKEGRTALRFGIVEQLRLLALHGPIGEVRKKSIKWLEFLANPEAWGDDPEVMEELLNSLGAIANSQEEEKEQAEKALKSLTDSSPSAESARNLRPLPSGNVFSWGGELPTALCKLDARRAITEWLGGKSLEDKLRALSAPSAAPASESLFLAIKSLLREEAPKEYELRRQLTLKVNTLLPPPAVSFFVGRAQELKAFRQSFQAQQERIIAPPITGPGGVGKTQLALRVIQQQVEETPYDYVFWIPAESEEKLLEAYLRIAEGLRIHVDKKELQQATQTVRLHLKDKHCLYVFDDAPDIKAIQDFLPLGQGHVLITSRNSRVGAWPTKPLLMNPFGEQEALALAQEFGHEQSSQEQEALQSLLKQVPCYPLTLVQLFSTLEAEGLDAAAFLEAMQQHTATEKEQALITLLGERPHARVDYAQSMVYVLKTSLERLSQELQGEKALQLISQLAYLDPKGIPMEWLLTWDREDSSLLKRNTRAVLSLLEKYSLLQWDKGDKQVYLHAETQLMVRHLHPQDSLTALINSLVDYVGAKEEAFQNAAKWSSLLPHGRILFERLTIPQYPQEAYLLTQYLANACEVGCLFKESVSWAEKRLEIAKQRYPAQDHPDIAESLNNVGLSLSALGEEKEALEYQKQALAMQERLYPAQDHPNIASSLNNVGLSLYALGQAKEALEYKKQALEMQERLYPAQDHPDIATSLNNVGGSLDDLGQAQEALEYEKQALEMQERLYPAQDHPDIATSLNNVGMSLSAL
ncbi:MAG: tetratricopeptide repeat protein, partial [Cytophagales bacterium]|nr:tetratricopeptide repeat protein [Cytophagales bacterium]